MGIKFSRSKGYHLVNSRWCKIDNSEDCKEFSGHGKLESVSGDVPYEKVMKKRISHFPKGDRALLR